MLLTPSKRAPGFAFLRHRLPHLGIRFAPAVVGRGSVQDITVQMIRAQVFERTGHRLRYLNRQACLWVVRQAVVLARAVGEFRLQKKIMACDDAGLVRGG
jgi:hypothetical protein